MTRGRLLGALALILTLSGAWSAFAGPPTEHIRTEVDRVIRILEDPALDGPAKTDERRKALREASDTIFDWLEMAKRALARHWQGRTEVEREEFARLFADLLEHSYTARLERYGGERVRYVGESIDGAHALVRTRMITKQGQEVPADYRMIRRGDRWLIYDVVVEGVSLISSYRTQFDRIIRSSSYEDLVHRMRSRQLLQKSKES